MSCNGFYLTGNYPDENTFLQAALYGLRHFDFFEVGVPFSDPIADGAVLSTASHRAVTAGVTTASVLTSVMALKNSMNEKGINKKVYIMTYANKLYSSDITAKFQSFADSGVDGIIAADVPFVESGRFADSAAACSMDYIHFVTPESTRQQIQQICAEAKGFIYAVSLRGTTGRALVMNNEIKDIIHYTKHYAKVPVVLGFGIQNKHDAQTALQYADGYIIGTALVEKLETGLESYTAFIDELSA